MNTGKDTTPLDFIGMMMLLFRKWKVLLKACFIGGIVSIIVAFSIPKEYTSTAVLAPELASGGGISSSFGSLAAMAGIDLGGISGGEDAVYPELYPQIVGSTPFLTELMELPVTTKDDKLQTDLYHYLRYHQRHPWWSVAMEAPIKLIKKLVSHNVPDTIMPSRDADPMLLSRSQQLVLKSLGKKIVTSVDKGNNVITLGVTMQDPLIAAVVAQHVSDNLQQYVADYRSAKARKDLAYTEQLFDEARDKYYAAQKAYATDDLRGHAPEVVGDVGAGDVVHIVDEQTFRQGNDARPQAHQHMRPHAGRPVFRFPLHADDGPEDHRGHNTQQHLPERQRLPEAYPVQDHGAPPANNPVCVSG